MSRDLKLSVTISLKDAMSKQADRALTAMTQAAVRASTGMVKANDKIISSNHRLFMDRERLGVRSEQRIQREIRLTEASYRRLMQSGNLTWREQVKATEAMRSKVQQLNNEMGKLTGLQRAAAGGRFVAGTVAGAVAAGMVVKPGVDKAMAYDLRLANMANTAFAGQSLSEKRAGKAQLDAAIISAIRNGGGARDSAAQTLDSIFASGAIKDSQKAMRLLAPTMKAATAANGDATDFAMVGVKSVQSFGIDPEKIDAVYDAMVAGGQAGSFEAKDQARWLPQQMAAARLSGYSGQAGLKQLIAYNQAAATTAGSSDEAGNNLVNLLLKINSRDTALDVKKSLGINLPKYLAQQKDKGVDSVSAFADLIDKSVENNPAYKQLKQKLATAKDDPTRQATLASMVDIVQGSTIGAVIQDQQALKAAVGIIGSRKNGYLDSVTGSMNRSNVVADNFALISETASFRAGQAGNEKEVAQQRVMDNLTPSIGALSDKVVAAAQVYPGLTTATVAATTALAALAAAGAGAAATSILTGGEGKAGAIKGAAGMALREGAKFMFKRVLPAYAAFEGGQFVGEHLINKPVNWGLSKFTGEETNIGTFLYDLTHKEQKVGGDIRIKIDQDGRASVASVKPSQPGVRFNVHAGPTMAVGN